MRSCVLIYVLFGVFFFCAEAQQAGKTQRNKEQQRADSLMLSADWQTAARLYQSVLKEEPDNARAWSSLGFCNHYLKQYEKALDCYRKALAVANDSLMVINIQIRLARAYALMNQYDNTLSSLSNALNVGFRRAGELEKEVDFNGLRDDPRFKSAVDKARENAFPCMRKEKLREFDFWIGDWTAYVTGTNQTAGYSRIDRASGGCMILENWTSAGNVPFTGKSINFIDASTGKWKQVWIGSDTPEISEFVNGSYRDGAMRFEFDENTPDGKKQSVQFTFYNEGPNQVRQHHVTSVDGGKTWNTTYDFTYRRNKQ